MNRHLKIKYACRRAYFGAVRRWLIFWIELLYGADMFWNQDDPEHPHDSVETWAQEDHTYFGELETRHVTMMRAFCLPTRSYVVRPVIYDDSDDVDWNVERGPAPKRMRGAP